MSGLWIGEEGDSFKVGASGFLVCLSHAMKGWERYELRERPAKTNQSYRERLRGWCGTTNDVCCYAHGLAVVDRVARNGRAYVRHVEPGSDEEKQLLEELGYPELVGE